MLGKIEEGKDRKIIIAPNFQPAELQSTLLTRIKQQGRQLKKS